MTSNRGGRRECILHTDLQNAFQILVASKGAVGGDQRSSPTVHRCKYWDLRARSRRGSHETQLDVTLGELPGK
jgi:hypothetical protein